MRIFTCCVQYRPTLRTNGKMTKSNNDKAFTLTDTAN